ncbi:DNA gyrase subunit B [Devosia sp.]|jgi:ElaB/YqjD/DUF883 family membrane-anchored ribosome-binding protein|uniref:DUF883 family protein n=1 Tax=Devosia sp. TaxID=1871048 RepID=UPI001B250D65|nr:DNA gyrase subunit B [Devosia sp.]MBO9587166.1 DUF883 family protein [Devosia sp.]
MASTTDMAPTTTRKSGSSASSRRPATKTREQELEAQVAQLQSDLKSITETLRKLTGEKAGEVRDIAEAEFRHLKRRGQHMVEEAQDQAGEYEQQLKDTIREKPLTAVATALGIGFVLALLTR